MSSVPDESLSKAPDDIYAEWDPMVESMLEQWKLVCSTYGLAYGITSQWYGKWHLAIEVPIVLLSMVTTTVSWGDLGSPWLTPAVSTIVTILTSLRSFLSLGTKSSDYGKVSLKFRQLARKIDRELIMPARSRKPTSVFVNDIARQMDQLMNDASAINGIIPSQANKHSASLANGATADIDDLEVVVSKMFQGPQESESTVHSVASRVLSSFPRMAQKEPDHPGPGVPGSAEAAAKS